MTHQPKQRFRQQPRLIMEPDSETDLDVQAQIAKQKEQLLKHKSKGADAGKKNNKIKRVITGIMFAAFGFSPIYLGPTYVLISAAIIVSFMFTEHQDIGRDSDKDQVNFLSGVWIEWVMFLTTMVYVTPKIILKQNLLVNSGLTVEEYPLLHLVFYEHNDAISLTVFMGILLWFVLSLKQGVMSYQFKCFGSAILRCIFISYVFNCYASLIFYGKAWAIYVPLIVTVNDVAAYVSGVTMGRTPLIKLSPNKTMEGFVGGAILTLLFTFLLVDYLFAIEWCVCTVDHLSLAPFEKQICEIPAVYHKQSYSLPFVFMGYSSFEASSAQLTACLFGLFASLVSPFGGFLASGMKRAYQLKDFSNLLPGHGGMLDRLDCVMVLCLFGYNVLSGVLFKDQHILTELPNKINESLSYHEKVDLAKWLAQEINAY